MLKVQAFTLCLSISLVTLAHTIPLEPKDAWKSLENPRNRELFFRTLQAYFSGRGFDVGKISKSLRMDNRRPFAAAALYPDHVASAFSDYEGQKDSFAAFLKG
ncbi:uncharacterized protein C2orf66 homolog isoform X2 [Cetorhinus maximus]